MSTPTPFPLRGVIGVVANSIDEIHQAKAKALQCIELRADLLLKAGLSEAQLYSSIELARSLDLAVLFTLRHPSHGGVFSGTESSRLQLSYQALDAGADLFDLEWGTEAATEALAISEKAGDAKTRGDKMILSHHDFDGMPSSQELAQLTEAMQSSGARAIKVVPTAMHLKDAFTMLHWVGEAANHVGRIGFAMGETGACSRILTTARGGAVTYASFGEAVAPGQIELDELLSHYRVAQLSAETEVIAVCGEAASVNAYVSEKNLEFATNAEDRVVIGFAAQHGAYLEENLNHLGFSEVLALK